MYNYILNCCVRGKEQKMRFREQQISYQRTKMGIDFCLNESLLLGYTMTEWGERGQVLCHFFWNLS